MPKLPTILPLDWSAAEVAEFALIALAMVTGAGAIGCNFTAVEELLLGKNAHAWQMAGAWCTWIAVLSGSTCIALAFHGVGRGPKGRRRGHRHAPAQRYVWPEVGAQVVAKRTEPAARMDETQQAELAQQLALVEAQGSLVMTQPAAPKRVATVTAGTVGGGR